MTASVPAPKATDVAGRLTVESMGVVRRRRSTARRLDALARLESERSRLVRQTEWSVGRAIVDAAGAGETPVTAS